MEQLTSGIDEPLGLAVDGSGALYAANYGNGTVSVFPHGESAPSETLNGPGGSNLPGFVAVGPDGTVYVGFKNSVGGLVAVYPAGQTAPSKEILRYTDGSYPEGIALDAANNLYVAIAFQGSTGRVLRVRAGRSRGEDLGIRLTDSTPGGIAFDSRGNLLVVDQLGNSIDVFAPGEKKPKEQEVVGSYNLFAIALNRQKTEVFVTSLLSGVIVGVSYPGFNVVDTIYPGLFVAGVATSPVGAE